jgi:ornithine cyclodeaminase
VSPRIAYIKQSGHARWIHDHENHHAARDEGGTCGVDLIPEIEAGFVAYSEHRAEVPPVGALRFTNPPGDVHIKYGYLHDDEFYVIKIASGFYENPSRGLPSGNGLMLLFDQKTGELAAVLLDEGYLTDLRTAVAGAIAAKYLAPRTVTRIGIFGTGVQARLQTAAAPRRDTVPRGAGVGRHAQRAADYKAEMEREGFTVAIAGNMRDVPRTCDLIVTTTAAAAPLILAADARPGTHITAVGADSAHKQELDAAIFSTADVVVVDSVSQCADHGDLAHAVRAGLIQPTDARELGAVIAGRAPGRTSPAQLTVADLTASPCRTCR